MSFLNKTNLDSTGHESIFCRRSKIGNATERTSIPASSKNFHGRSQRLTSGLKDLKNKIDNIVQLVQEKRNNTGNCCQNVIRTNCSISQYYSAAPYRSSSKSFGAQLEKTGLMNTSVKFEESYLFKPKCFNQNLEANEKQNSEQTISQRLLNANMQLSYCLQAQMARNKQLQESQLYLTSQINRMKNISNKRFSGQCSYQPSALQSYCNSEKSMGNSLRY